MCSTRGSLEHKTSPAQAFSPPHIPPGSFGYAAAGKAQSPEDWPLTSFWELSSEPLQSSASSRVLHTGGLGPPGPGLIRCFMLT